MTLPDQVFAQYPKTRRRGAGDAVERRERKWPEVYRKMRGWLFRTSGDITR